MNGQELSARLDGMTKAQLRRIYAAAAAELGWTGSKLAVRISDTRDCETPFEWTFEAVWMVQCEKRIFNKTGKKVLVRAWTANGSDRMIAEEVCDWTESSAAVERCLAAAGR